MNKEECRKKCLENFKKSATNGKLKRDKMVEDRLFKLLKKRNSKNILIYLPLYFEANLMPLIKRMRKSCNFYIPFMQDVSFKMVPYRLPIKNYKFNIKQSGDSNFKIFKVDTVIVP
ncbi:MAG: 5-formyltetrahydrofolate cyclo-ligase, partial [Campylobacterota bacterium]|nr:5-formyltetrahydrofolate cyclo-ligase [Campylobacterota bacterium]